MKARILEDRKRIEEAGIEVPENGKIESLSVRPYSHEHQFFKCHPVKFAWKC